MPMQRGLAGLAGILVTTACGHMYEGKAKQQALEGVLPLQNPELIRKFALSEEEQERARVQARVIFSNSIKKDKVPTHVMEYGDRQWVHPLVDAPVQDVPHEV